MNCADLIDGNATESKLKAHPVQGENAAAKVHVSKRTRNRAKQAAKLSGMNFTSLAKMNLIEHLPERDR